jgi:RNA-directed DNA polymerase
VVCRSRQQAEAALARLRARLAELSLVPKEAKTRDRITKLTIRSRPLLPVKVVREDLNGFLRGWADYFRYGHRAVRFDQIQQHGVDRLALFVGKRHKRGRGFGLSVLDRESADRCGLHSLSGTVIASRANRPWREKPPTSGERRR